MITFLLIWFLKHDLADLDRKVISRKILTASKFVDFSLNNAYLSFTDLSRRTSTSQWMLLSSWSPNISRRFKVLVLLSKKDYRFPIISESRRLYLWVSQMEKRKCKFSHIKANTNFSVIDLFHIKLFFRREVPKLNVDTIGIKLLRMWQLLFMERNMIQTHLTLN